ncbi:Uncharacterized conserved protein [Altererythrobacter xiamenensis]|uniref:Uncharacterized conserved protein n=1 Tax=Altererythrobacter xiamenensis TaxID=1316679 RepID=A0A1Y6F9N1_9SPHN|nr:exopolysaccharide biosynthesis protein [Altererythrobacter xiamenensis]SMQ69462.1 Uncharacterized conserved protein [Altererythrobacter xiamenensis]
MSKEPQSVEEAVEALEDVAEHKSDVSIGDVLDEFGRRSFGPFLMIFALIEITPVGGIPGVPTFLAVICAFIAVQLLFGAEHVWVPGWIENRSVSGKKLGESAEKLANSAEKLDHWFHGRMERFTRPLWHKIAAVMILLLCVTVPPLELLPFASSAPMLAIASFGLALTVRDGLLMLIAIALSIAAIGFGTYYYYTSDSGSESAEGSGGFI